MIRVGTAGWSYPDWDGVVYPRGTASSRAALERLARLFDTLEINVTFYRPPESRLAEGWARRVDDRADFLFTAKLWQGFTHQREDRHEAEEVAFKEGLRPLVEARRLGALLVQFPHSFHHTPAGRRYLESLLERFSGWPLVVELRHASWMQPDFLATLETRGAGFCNVDQPAIGRAAPPSTVMSGPAGYVRLHGRNSDNWFRRDATRDRRYDYLYASEELRAWADRIRTMQAKAGGRDIFVIANNHYRGQAAANALELKSMLVGSPVEIPGSLVAAFPRLEPIADAGRAGMLPL